uniref:sugar transferase n=1 Tax=Amaricoccus sp. TaxID=1872485 RepID=UPI002638D6CA
MSERVMAEMPPLLAEVPSQGMARGRNDLLSAVRGDAPGGGGAGVASQRRPLGGPLKRGVDLVVAAASLILFLPIVLMITLLILLTMGRPVLFAHPRVGFQRTPFLCHKFRSMVRDSERVLQRHLAENPEAAREWNETQKLRNDPRVTFVGRMLRKSSLDELPQLINV